MMTQETKKKSHFRRNLFLLFIAVFSALFQTGWAVSAATVISPELAQMPALSLLFISPFGLMEITAYAIAMSRSVILVQTLVNRTIRTQLKSTLKEIGIVIGLLLAGGFLEYAMIQWAIENGYNLVEMMS